MVNIPFPSAPKREEPIEASAPTGDNDAKNLSRRCFRLAEIFIEEQTRRR
jgi:hypothetical protein